MSTVTDPADKYGALLHAAKQLDDAQRKSIDCAAKRHALPPGSSRARVTTANANHANAAERRDKCIDVLDRELQALGLVRDEVAIGISALKQLGYNAQRNTCMNPAIVLVEIHFVDTSTAIAQKLDREHAAKIFAAITGRTLVGQHTDGSYAFSS